MAREDLARLNAPLQAELVAIKAEPAKVASLEDTITTFKNASTDCSIADGLNAGAAIESELEQSAHVIEGSLIRVTGEILRH